MANLSILSTGLGVNPFKFNLSDGAKQLIKEFEDGLKERLSADMFQPKYTGIDDILTQKFKLEDIDNLETPDLSEKTEFIIENIRGNFQKASGNVLTYKEAESIISDAANEELP